MSSFFCRATTSSSSCFSFNSIARFGAVCAGGVRLNVPHQVVAGARGVRLGSKIFVPCGKHFVVFASKESTSGDSMRTLSSTGEEDKEAELFPWLTPAGRNLFRDLLEQLENEIGSFLDVSRTPSDVRRFTSPQGTGSGSITLRAGKEGSKIDYLLNSWLHASLPFGTLDIATLLIMIGPEIDSPHFLFEFIQSNGNLVIVLDLLPRKDLVRHADYLARIYGDAELESAWHFFINSPEALVYRSPVAFVRSVVSPSAIMVKFNPAEDVLLEEIIAKFIDPGAKSYFSVWLKSFRTKGASVNDPIQMLERDNHIKTLGLEVDLTSNMPRLFGQEITDRVVDALRKGI